MAKSREAELEARLDALEDRLAAIQRQLAENEKVAAEIVDDLAGLAGPEVGSGDA